MPPVPPPMMCNASQPEKRPGWTPYMGVAPPFLQSITSWELKGGETCVCVMTSKVNDTHIETSSALYSISLTNKHLQ